MHLGPKKLRNALSMRLVGLLVATTMLVTATNVIINLESSERHWLHLVESCAHRTNELVRRATHYGMLLNRKEDVARLINDVAASEGVHSLRVFDKLGKISFSSNPEEIGQLVDMSAESCSGCHAGGGESQEAPLNEDRIRIFTLPSGEGIVGLTHSIVNKPECYNAACHAHSPEQRILGVLDVQMSTAAVAANLKETKEQMIFVALLAAAIIGLLGGLLLNRTIRTPLESIYEGTQLVAKGDLSQKIKIQNNDEFGQLADAFNTMTADLKRARDDLTRWSQSLEKRVVEKTDEVGRMQRQVVHVEKMASLGKLSATVAHELNNPLAAILTYAKLVDRSLPDSLTPELREELGRYLSLVQKESTRCGKIVRNLLLFARQSGGAFAPTEIRPVIDRSIMLVQHHLQMSNIILEQNLCDGDDYASCDGDQIQQALLALMMNAVEAMSGDGEGTLTIVLRGDDASMTLAIKDTGPGILDENLPHIFEPFFSTKHAESDVGLGLAVVYGIVRRHGGKIDVDSAPGQGTSFTIWLPRNPPAERPSEEGDFLV